MNVINWSGRASLFTFPKHTRDIVAPTVSVMYITDTYPKLVHSLHLQGGRRSWPLQQDGIPAGEDEPRHQKVLRKRP